MSPYNSFVCGPKFSKFLLSNVEGAVVDQILSRFAILWAVYAGPALGMFEVFGRTGPQNLGGGAILGTAKINLPVWTTMMFRWRKLPTDTRFDVSLDWLSFYQSLQADQKTKNAATRCILRTYKTAKYHCVRGSASDPAGGAYSDPYRPHGGAAG